GEPETNFFQLWYEFDVSFSLRVIQGTIPAVRGNIMRCSNCGTDNAAGSRFCNHCGTQLGRQSAKGAFDNDPKARFCSQCGAPLDSPPEPVRAPEPLQSPTGERRHLTVLF